MKIILAILIATLTRAEIIERMRAVPITKQNGLVQVIADCPKDMREEFQLPIAGFTADICASLYRAKRLQPKKFSEPGIYVYIGEGRTNRTDVISRKRTRSDGTSFTRIYLPSPGFSDVNRLRCEVVKAFYFAVDKEDIDDKVAIKRLRDANPEMRLADSRAELKAWLQGGKVDQDDEYYIRLFRAILKPGVATKDEVLHFASRLWFYPEIYSSPFDGKYEKCSFKDAILLAKKDPRIRFMAYSKASQVILYGGGRGEELLAAADAYAIFLRELAAYNKTPEELKELLLTADEKLNIALEKAQ